MLSMYNVIMFYIQFISAKIDNNDKEQHWETVPVTSSLVIKYCQAAEINIIEDDDVSLTMTNSF